MATNCVIILSPSEWGQVAVSNMQYALRFSRSSENTVYYFESIATRTPKITDIPRIFKRLSKSVFHFQPVKKNFMDPEAVKLRSPLVIPWHENILVRAINKIILKSYINKIISSHKGEKILFIIYNPYWLDIVKEIDTPYRLVFHCVDKLSTYSSSKVYLKRLEELKKSADAIVVPNEILKSEFNGCENKITVIPHGCSHEASMLRTKNNFKVVYSGNLADWVDYELLINTVNECPQTEFHFVGSITAKSNLKMVNSLFSKDNVVYHGQVAYGDLAAIYKKCSIGIVPYDPDNLHIKFSTPTKFLDYIFAGLKVVSTDFQNAREFNGLIEIAKSPSDFTSLINSKVEFDNSYINERDSLINQASWDSRFKQLKDVVFQE